MGGTSTSGSATGGSGFSTSSFNRFRRPSKRQYRTFSGFGGGNAVSGSTGDVDGGDVVNDSDADGTITNDAGANLAGMGGTTESGDAVAGDSTGGSAFSGNTGNARGGSVYNSGGDITNDAGASKYLNTHCAEVMDNIYLLQTQLEWEVLLRAAVPSVAAAERFVFMSPSSFPVVVHSLRLFTTIQGTQ